jgi:hypothetical protein
MVTAGRSRRSTGGSALVDEREHLIVVDLTGRVPHGALRDRGKGGLGGFPGDEGEEKGPVGSPGFGGTDVPLGGDVVGYPCLSAGEGGHDGILSSVQS